MERERERTNERTNERHQLNVGQVGRNWKVATPARAAGRPPARWARRAARLMLGTKEAEGTANVNGGERAQRVARCMRVRGDLGGGRREERARGRTKERVRVAR